MISRFINLFRKTDVDEQRFFQTRVLKILRELHPETNYSSLDDPLALGLDGQVFGLTNVRAAFLLSPQTEDDLRAIVSDHFQSALAAAVNVDERTELSWDAARPDLMPQLMPVEFLEKVDLAVFPFAGEIAVGFVVDAEKTYSYVSKKDLERWQVTELDVHEIAMQNLNNRSDEMPVTGVPGPNGFCAVNTMDGFDAVRIVSAELRAYFTDLLGGSFYFGVPNRDFLICWANNDDKEFQDEMRAKIAQDFEEQPYPLSPLVLEATENGEFRQVDGEHVDPRSVVAHKN